MELHLEGNVCSQFRTWLVADFCEGKTYFTNGDKDMCSPSAQQWWGHVRVMWPDVGTEVPVQERWVWRSEPRKRLKRWWRVWNICCMRRGWEIWDFPVLRRKGSGRPHNCEQIPDGVGSKKNGESGSSQQRPVERLETRGIDWNKFGLKVRSILP